MTATPHLKSLQALELAVRTGSLRAAAGALAITPAAVGQRIKALEDYLGIDLLTRARSGLKPTPALAGALPHLAAAFHELEAVSALLDLQRGQEIHIAAASDFAELWLKPRLAAFRSEQPNTLFCVNGEGEVALRLGPVDCEISFGPPRESGDRLFGDFVLPISSPENTARITRLKPQDRLEGFPLLHLDFYKDDPSAPNWSKWIAAHRLRRTAPERGIRFQRITPVLEAVLADAGLAICGAALIAPLIDDGRLSLPFPVSTGTWTEHAFHARFRPDALSRPQVKRFRDWLLSQATATGAWLQHRFGRHGRSGQLVLKPDRTDPNVR
ncbi:LysR substrate-binding domain-containing protein [Phenylobacterium montanum]|uniref:LysR family transcriptional regulator n=1 Tax=Phenylobacterium montanum TaxID=2823693 RepID=A0A975G415_9CAUL|nr:LysR substrate-binding domain-containing protein [Caulobacter sp. S6]QUD90173.1 LysR family transcriptional regulator [Caulobacter sp. S6]